MGNYKTDVRIFILDPNLPGREVTLVPDRDEYHPGDTAELLVIPPFTPAEGLVTIRRTGIVHTERFTIAGGSYTLRIPIEERWTPNVFVQVDLVGAATRVVPPAQCGARGMNVSLVTVNYPPEGDSPADAAFTPDGSKIVVAHRDSHNLVVFDAATRTATMEIEVPNPGYRLKPGMYADIIAVPGDPLKDVNAAVIALENGLGSRTAYLAEQGEDFEEICEELARRFRTTARTFFPVPLPFEFCNLFIGLTLRPR